MPARRPARTPASRAPGPTRPPHPPRLPAGLDPAPGRLGSRDSWDGVEAGADTEVDDVVDEFELIGSRLVGVDLTSRRMPGLRARDVVFDRCDLSGAVLDGAHLDRVRFSGCRLTGAMFSATRLRDVVISDSVGILLNLRLADAETLWIERTTLREAELGGATLVASALLDCDLSGATVTGLRAADLALHGSTLDAVIGATSLGGARIGPEQLVDLAAALAASLGITLTDRPD